MPTSRFRGIHHRLVWLLGTAAICSLAFVGVFLGLSSYHASTLSVQNPGAHLRVADTSVTLARSKWTLSDYLEFVLWKLHIGKPPFVYLAAEISRSVVPVTTEFCDEWGNTSSGSSESNTGTPDASSIPGISVLKTDVPPEQDSQH